MLAPCRSFGSVRFVLPARWNAAFGGHRNAGVAGRNRVARRPTWISECDPGDPMGASSSSIRVMNLEACPAFDRSHHNRDRVSPQASRRERTQNVLQRNRSRTPFPSQALPNGICNVAVGGRGEVLCRPCLEELGCQSGVLNIGLLSVGFLVWPGVEAEEAAVGIAQPVCLRLKLGL